MPLRIACDLDGTLADMHAALQREAERISEEPIDVTAPVIRGGVPTRDESAAGARRRLQAERERSRLWSRLREIDNFWETLPEIETGAVARLAAVAASQGWEVLFLTRRPDTAGDTVQVQSQRWLRAHGFELPSVYVVSGSRGAVAASLALDCVIDDRPDNCVDVAADSSARPVLVWRDSPQHMPPGLGRFPIHVVSSMAEAIAHLEDLQTRTHPQRGLLSRLRRALLHS